MQHLKVRGKECNPCPVRTVSEITFPWQFLNHFLDPKFVAACRVVLLFHFGILLSTSRQSLCSPNGSNFSFFYCLFYSFTSLTIIAPIQLLFASCLLFALLFDGLLKCSPFLFLNFTSSYLSHALRLCEFFFMSFHVLLLLCCHRCFHHIYLTFSFRLCDLVLSNFFMISISCSDNCCFFCM